MHVVAMDLEGDILWATYTPRIKSTCPTMFLGPFDMLFVCGGGECLCMDMETGEVGERFQPDFKGTRGSNIATMGHPTIGYTNMNQQPAQHAVTVLAAGGGTSQANKVRHFDDRTNKFVPGEGDGGGDSDDSDEDRPKKKKEKAKKAKEAEEAEKKKKKKKKKDESDEEDDDLDAFGGLEDEPEEAEEDNPFEDAPKPKSKDRNRGRERARSRGDSSFGGKSDPLALMGGDLGDDPFADQDADDVFGAEPEEENPFATPRVPARNATRAKKPQPEPISEGEDDEEDNVTDDDDEDDNPFGDGQVTARRTQAMTPEQRYGAMAKKKKEENASLDDLLSW